MSEENDEKDDIADALASMRTVSESVPSPLPEISATPRSSASSVESRSAPKPRDSVVKSTALDRAINMRRTFIPVLLTLGLLLPSVATLKYLTNPESPFRSWSNTHVLLLAAVGLVSFILAIINIMEVQNLLRQRRRSGN